MSVMEKPHSRAELTGIQGMLAKVSVARCRMLHKSCLGVSVMGCSPVLRMPFLCAFLSLPCGGDLRQQLSRFPARAIPSSAHRLPS